MNRSSLIGMSRALLLSFLGIAAWTISAHAYVTYSENDDATNCRACHGDFRSSSYISPTDGMNWGNLHNLHRFDMVAGDCNVCHQPGSTFPVFLDDSDGGDGMESLGCVGCHGRAEDNVPANPEFNEGYGAGLRQHHFVSGVTVCANCHADASPASYTPVGENVLPPYYANPGIGHPTIPTDPCNPDGNEDFAGIPEGLDNDGDGAYDIADPDCGQADGCFLNCPQGDGGLISMNGNGNKSPDIDASGSVDVADFAQFAVNFNGTDYCTDFNCDGSVDVGDFAVFAGHFNHGPGPNGICE